MTRMNLAAEFLERAAFLDGVADLLGTSRRRRQVEALARNLRWKAMLARLGVPKSWLDPDKPQISNVVDESLVTRVMPYLLAYMAGIATSVETRCALMTNFAMRVPEDDMDTLIEYVDCELAALSQNPSLLRVTANGLASVIDSIRQNYHIRVRHECPDEPLSGGTRST